MVRLLVHNARIAERRGDRPQVAFLVGQMLEAIVAAAAARHRELGVWSKGGPRWLTEEELALVERCAREPGPESVQRLGELFERYAG